MPERGRNPDLVVEFNALNERVRRLERAVQIKAARTVFDAIGPGVLSDVDVNWPTPFTDGNYTVAVTVSAGSGSIRSLIIVRHDAAGITARIQNVGNETQAGTVHAVAIHD